MNIEEDIIKIYCLIEDIVGGMQIRRRGHAPALSDAEVLTIEIFGELSGFHGEKGIWRYTQNHWKEWFPALGSYKNFAKHCANIVWLKEVVLDRLFPKDRTLHTIDGVPMPVCHYARSNRCRSLKGNAAYGYCAAKGDYYYGLRGHLLMNDQGYIVLATYTPANVDERTSLDHLHGNIRDIVLADKGFIDQNRKADLVSSGINLQTPLRKNMTENRPPDYLSWLLKTRKLIETAISQLTEIFLFNNIKARTMHHLLNKAARKILAYNFSILLKS